VRSPMPPPNPTRALRRRAAGLLPAAVFALLAAASPAAPQTDVRMGVRRTGFERIPIEMEGIEGPREHARNLEQVIRSDLDLSDLFVLVDDRAGLGRRPQVSVRGRLEMDRESLALTLFLEDVYSGGTILGKRYHFDPEQHRRAAHHFVDQVVYSLTGEQGIAQTRVLFVRPAEDARTKELYLVDYDGHRPQLLTTDGSVVTAPEWAPSGRAFLFTSFRAGSADLYLWDIPERAFRRWVSFPGTNTSPSWTGVRNEIAASLSLDGNAEIYVLDPSGRILRRLTHNWAIDTSPSWGANGREIAFCSDRAGRPHLYVMDAEGGNLRKLTFEGDHNDSPAWSPRGDRIAYVSRVDGFFQIFLMRADGSGKTQLTRGSGNHEDPSWAPDGRHLVYSVDRGLRKDLYVMSVDSGRTRRLVEGENPSWSPPLDRSGREMVPLTHNP
jgi:TolB protein